VLRADRCFDVVEPDLLCLSNERATEILTEKHVTGAPEIVVEIASPATRKRDETFPSRLRKLGTRR
jgi:Uma2 family endonuclease